MSESLEENKGDGEVGGEVSGIHQHIKICTKNYTKTENVHLDKL